MSRRLPTVLAVLAVAVGMAPGAGAGGNASCSPGLSVEVPAASTPGQPRRVSTGANIVCPTPQSPPGSSFGPHAPPQQPVRGTPNDDCTQQLLEPMELQLTDGGQELVFWPDPSFNGNGSVTPEPQDVARIISGIDAKDFFEKGGTTDFFLPFTLKGKVDPTGFKCIPKDPADPQASFTNNCNGAATFAFACIVKQTHPIGGAPIPIGQLQGGLVDIRARMLQLIHPGQISTLPAQPNPALVNVRTCFFINGADIDGQNVNQPATFELVLLGPPDATGRQVYYVFRVEVALQPSGVTWTFGDGSTATEGLPPDCIGVSNAPLQFAHRYLRYSPPGGFPVTATETFTLHVTEYYYDSSGANPVDLGDLPPITVNPGPAGGFSKVVVQEEGIPIG